MALMRVDPGGKLILEQYLSLCKPKISPLQRQEIVRICVSHLIKRFGYYPSTAAKKAIAQDIVRAFPCLALIHNNLPSWSAYFSEEPNANSFIQTRLKTERKNKGVCKRKKSTKGKQPAKKGKKGRRSFSNIDPYDENEVETFKLKVSMRDCSMCSMDI